jgi:hypothetical protein
MKQAPLGPGFYLVREPMDSENTPSFRDIRKGALCKISSTLEVRELTELARQLKRVQIGRVEAENTGSFAIELVLYQQDRIVFDGVFTDPYAGGDHILGVFNDRVAAFDAVPMQGVSDFIEPGGKQLRDDPNCKDGFER